jgi:hypothetical protein
VEGGGRPFGVGGEGTAACSAERPPASPEGNGLPFDKSGRLARRGGPGQCMIQPPSTHSSCPVMKELSGALKNNTALATSPGTPRRLTACWART